MQTTVSKPIIFEGVGLHKGLKSKLSVLPAEIDFGICFKRVDMQSGDVYIPAILNNVVNSELCTRLENSDGISVSTIEHLMAALAGCGINNALLEIDGPEVPILDGSAMNFIKLFKNIGLKNSDVPIKLIKINNSVKIEEGNKFISIEKSNTTLEIEFEINYENQIIKNQKNKINVFEDKLDDIFNSRTFCLYEDIERLKKIGLGKGGSLENAIVVRDDKILNEEGLRNKHEDLIVVVTGGDTFFFENALKNSIFAEKNLVLKGLNIILQYNEDK